MKNGTYGGYVRGCRCELCREGRRAYYDANRDAIAEKKRAYRDANRDAIAEKQRAYYQCARCGHTKRTHRADDGWLCYDGGGCDCSGYALGESGTRARSGCAAP